MLNYIKRAQIHTPKVGPTPTVRESPKVSWWLVGSYTPPSQFSCLSRQNFPVNGGRSTPHPAFPDSRAPPIAPGRLSATRHLTAGDPDAAPAEGGPPPLPPTPGDIGRLCGGGLFAPPSIGGRQVSFYQLCGFVVLWGACSA